MANYAPVNLVKAQAKMQEMFNKGELRYRKPVTFLEFVSNGEIMIPSHKQLRTREDRVVEVNYLNRTARALGSARAHNHTGVKSDGSVLTPSWSPYTDKFNYSLKQAGNNVYALEEMIAHEYGQVITNFAEGLETAAGDYLFANRSGVNGVAVEGAFDATDDVFKITETTNGERAIQIAKSTMDILKYQGSTYTFFCDTVSYNKFEYQANQGGGNSTNLSFQFGNIKFVHTPSFNADAAGLTVPITKGFWVAVPTGMIASLDWIPMENRMGISTKENEYGTILNPVDGLAYAQHKYDTRADDTANNGYVQDVVTQIEISVDIALEHAPLTTANETPIQAFALV